MLRIAATTAAVITITTITMTTTKTNGTKLTRAATIVSTIENYDGTHKKRNIRDRKPLSTSRDANMGTSGTPAKNEGRGEHGYG